MLQPRSSRSVSGDSRDPRHQRASLDVPAPEKAEAYIEVYDRLREEGWKELVHTTTRRQFATAREILDRMNAGQQGVLLADDVGLGKTTVAALCALVFAGSEKRVRILAPNEMMSRRWRQELEVHIEGDRVLCPAPRP